MKKQTKSNRSSKSRRPSRRRRSSGQLANGATDQHCDEVAKGILSVDIQKKGREVQAVVVRLAPHHIVVITGGSSPSVAMSCTHHGFVAEAVELNGQLEKVINHVRKHFPKLRID
ncbi:MAG: hypothetical protein ACKOIB_03395 [Verrucomicrobiota bacterium]